MLGNESCIIKLWSKWVMGIAKILVDNVNNYRFLEGESRNFIVLCYNNWYSSKLVGVIQLKW